MVDQEGIRLDEEERVELVRALEYCITEGRFEAARTDDRSYRKDVRHTVRVLQRVLDRLEAAGPRATAEGEPLRH